MFKQSVKKALLRSVTEKMNRGRPYSEKKKIEKYPFFESTSNDHADLPSTSANESLEQEPETIEEEITPPLLNVEDSLNEDELLEEESGNLFDEKKDDETDEEDEIDEEKEEEFKGEFFWTFLNQHHSKLTKLEMATFLVSLQRKYRITDVAMDGVIKLIKSCLKPISNIAFSSFRTVKKLVQTSMVEKNGQISSTIKTICEDCFKHIDIKTKKCENIKCLKNGQRQTAVQYFTCCLEKQVLALVKDHLNDILTYLNKSKQLAEGGKVTDVTNGSLYLSFGENPVDGTLTISLILNADGAQPLYASTGSLWPCDAVVAELPPKLRYSFENCIILAMWHGNHKPNWKEPLSELRDLQNDGVECNIGNITKIKIRILATVFDLPAIASFFEHTQWNGQYGCMDCQDVGKKMKAGPFIWPFAFESPEKSTQWYIDVYRYLKGRKRSIKEPFMGVRDESVLTEFIDVARQNPLDFMHQSYRGVVNRILNAVLKPATRGHRRSWNISNSRESLSQLDKLQSKMKFPHEFQRTVLPLDRWKQSKASECKNMILYTMVPCLKNILLQRGEEGTDFWHWLVLYNEISRRLTQDEIKINELADLEKMIDCWQLLVTTFLGERNCTYNIHATRHMPKYVRLLGPVHNYSTFAFEGFNGLYVRLVSSAFGSLDQIAERLELQQHCLHWISSAKPGSAALSASEIIFKEKIAFQKVTDKISVSNIVKIKVDDALISQFDLQSSTLRAFARAQCGATVLHSLDHERRKSTCSFIANFVVDGRTLYGEINQFISSDRTVYAYMQTFNVLDKNICGDSPPMNANLKKLWEEKLYGTFFKIVHYSGYFTLIPLQCFKTLCIFAKVDHVICLTDLAHQFEHN